MKLSALFLSLYLGLFATAAWAALKPGDAAPEFTLEAALGGKEFKFSLAEALKKGPVVLYFYPKSFTSICTVEAHEFAENIDNFAAAGASVIGISGDKIEVQRDFSTKECRDKFPVGAEGVAVHAFNQRDLTGILAMIRTLGALVGAVDRAEALARSYEARLGEVAALVRGRPRPKVYFEEWDDPLISGIGWVSELIEIAGGRDAFPGW